MAIGPNTKQILSPDQQSGIEAKANAQTPNVGGALADKQKLVKRIEAAVKKTVDAGKPLSMTDIYTDVLNGITSTPEQQEQVKKEANAIVLKVVSDKLGDVIGAKGHIQKAFRVFKGQETGAGEPWGKKMANKDTSEKIDAFLKNKSPNLRDLYDVLEDDGAKDTVGEETAYATILTYAAREASRYDQSFSRFANIELDAAGTAAKFSKDAGFTGLAALDLEGVASVDDLTDEQEAKLQEIAGEGVGKITGVIEKEDYTKHATVDDAVKSVITKAGLSDMEKNAIIITVKASMKKNGDTPPATLEEWVKVNLGVQKKFDEAKNGAGEQAEITRIEGVITAEIESKYKERRHENDLAQHIVKDKIAIADATKIKAKNGWTETQFEADIEGKIVAKRKELKAARGTDVEIMVQELLTKDDTFNLKNSILNSQVDALLNAIQKKTDEGDSLVAVLNAEGRMDFTDINTRVAARVQELQEAADRAKNAAEAAAIAAIELKITNAIDKKYFQRKRSIDIAQDIVSNDITGAEGDKIIKKNGFATGDDLKNHIANQILEKRKEMKASEGARVDAEVMVLLANDSIFDVKQDVEWNAEALLAKMKNEKDKIVTILKDDGSMDYTVKLFPKVEAKLNNLKAAAEKKEAGEFEAEVIAYIGTYTYDFTKSPFPNKNFDLQVKAITDEFSDIWTHPKFTAYEKHNPPTAANPEPLKALVITHLTSVRVAAEAAKAAQEAKEAGEFEAFVIDYIQNVYRYDATKTGFENMADIQTHVEKDARLAAYKKLNPGTALMLLIEAEVKKLPAYIQAEHERRFETAQYAINQGIVGKIFSAASVDEVVDRAYQTYDRALKGTPNQSSDLFNLGSTEVAQTIEKEIGGGAGTGTPEQKIKAWLKVKITKESTVIPEVSATDPKITILEPHEARMTLEIVKENIQKGTINIREKDILKAFPDVVANCDFWEKEIGDMEVQAGKPPLSKEDKDDIREDARSILRFVLKNGFPAPEVYLANQQIKDAITKCAAFNKPGAAQPLLPGTATFDDLLNLIDTDRDAVAAAIGEGGQKECQQIQILGLRRNLKRNEIGDKRWDNVDSSKNPPVWKVGVNRGWGDVAAPNWALYGEDITGGATTSTTGRRRRTAPVAPTGEPLTSAEIAEWEALMIMKNKAYPALIEKIANLTPAETGEGEKNLAKREAKRKKAAEDVEGSLDGYQVKALHEKYGCPEDDSDAAVAARVEAITKLINHVHGQRGEYIMSTESLSSDEKTKLFNNMHKIQKMLKDLVEMNTAGMTDESQKLQFEKELPERLYQIILKRGGETGDSESKKIYLQYIGLKNDITDIEDDVQMIYYLQMIRQWHSKGGMTANLVEGVKGYEPHPDSKWEVHGSDGTEREEFQEDLLRFNRIIELLEKTDEYKNDPVTTRKLLKIACENHKTLGKIPKSADDNNEDFKKLTPEEKAAHKLYWIIKDAGLADELRYAYKVLLFMEDKFSTLDIKKVKYWQEVDTNKKTVSTDDMDKSREDYAKARRKLQNFFGHKDAKTNIDPARDEYMRIYRQKITNDVKSHIDSSGGIPDKNGNRVYFRGYGTEAEKAPGRQALAQLIVKKILYERRQLLNAEIKNQSASHYEKFKTWWRKHPMWRMAGAVAISGTACMLGAPMIGYAALALGRAAGTFMATESIFESVRNRMTGRLAGNDKNARLARFTSLGLSMRPGYGAMPVLPAFDDEGGGRKYVKDVYGGVGMPNIGDYRARESQLLWQEQRNSVLETAAENAMKNSTTREDAIHKGIKAALEEEEKFMLAVEHQEKILRTTNIIKKSLAGLAALTVGTMALWGHVGVSHGATPHPGPGTGGNIPVPAPGEADDILPPESQTPEAPDPYSFQLTPEELEAQEALERQTIHLDMKGRQWNFAPGT